VDTLLARTKGYDVWLGPTVIVTGLIAASILFLFMAHVVPSVWLASVAGAVAIAAVLAGPTAYSVTTLGTVTGTIATAGPLSGAAGGGGNAKVSQELVEYLERHQSSATYLVAVNGSVTAAPFILQSGRPVIAMGGFTDTDPAPTLTEFKRLVQDGKVEEVFIPRSTATAGGGMTSTEAVDAWVGQHGTVVSPAAYGGGQGDRLSLYHVTSSDASK
jgi:4-amino-4-deoxy-L-arabinose transferase-like glycosyltransferase